MKTFTRVLFTLCALTSAAHFLRFGTLWDALPALTAELDGLARLRSEHPGEDGSARLLVELAGLRHRPRPQLPPSNPQRP